MPIFIQGICGIVGDQGSGKGFAMNKIGLQYANQIEYDICFNYEIDERAMYDYCLEMGYTWLMSRILHNQVRVKNSKDLIQFMDKPKTLYILDEAGVYLNSRRFMDIDPEFLHELAQVRHDSKLLWWVAQYPDMVDKMLRMLTASFIQVDGKQRYNKNLQNSELYWQRIYLFQARNFKIYLQKVHEKLTGIKYWINARKLAEFHWEGRLDYTDKMIFDIYQSFGYRVGDKVKKKRKTYKKLKTKINFLLWNENEEVPDILKNNQTIKVMKLELILILENPKILLYLITNINPIQSIKTEDNLNEEQTIQKEPTSHYDYSYLF